MKRSIMVTTVAMLVIMAGIGALAHAPSSRMIEVLEGIHIRVNGTTLADEGFLHEGRTFLPLRAVSEAVGADVEWDGATNTAVITTRSVPASDAFAVAEMADSAIALQKIRQATARYVDVEVAKKDGFRQASGMIPNHGIHFSNLGNLVRSLDLERPAGLIYVEKDSVWTLVAVEYTALFKPDKPMLPGGQWHKHDAACHYEDGNEIIESNPLSCPREHPRTHSAFDTWHPGIWTFHIWAWFPNPNGLAAEENPLLAAYNIPGVEVEHHHHDHGH